MSTEFEAVIGLEVHAQLMTKTKTFCGCQTTFGAEPNTQTCPVCLGLPGALPVLNKQVVALAIRAALALGCEIRLASQFARKNYFYPDLPKGYQISQFELPIAEQGCLEIPSYRFEERGGQSVRTAREGWKKIGITRIHIEEDAGKNIHAEGGGTTVDLNRAGVPLIEIVGEPDLRSSDDTVEYLKLLRQTLMLLGVCDGNMEEGSFRCDANVSIRPKGESKLGTRVELKNINSFRFVKQAIDYEVARQKAVLELGQRISQETRGFDHNKGITYKMRSKEDSDDYRYFPDPDLPLLRLEPAWVSLVSEQLPELPKESMERLERDFALSWQDAETICQEPTRRAYFEEAVREHHNAKGIANWILNDLLGALQGQEIANCAVSPKALAALVRLIDSGKITGKIGKAVFERMLSQGKQPEEIVEEEKLEVVSDTAALEAAAREIVTRHSKEAAEYRAGKEKLLGFFVGNLMKAMKGQAAPQIANEIMKKLLSEPSA